MGDTSARTTSYTEAERALRLIGNDTLDDLWEIIRQLQEQRDELQSNHNKLKEEFDELHDKWTSLTNQVEDLWRSI